MSYGVAVTSVWYRRTISDSCFKSTVTNTPTENRFLLVVWPTEVSTCILQLNIEPNHTTLAGHSYEHDVVVASK